MTDFRFIPVDQLEREQQEIRDLEALWNAIPQPKLNKRRRQNFWAGVVILVACAVISWLFWSRA